MTISEGMMAVIDEVLIAVKADVDTAKKQLDSLEKSSDKAEKSGTKLSNFMRSPAGLAGAAAVGAIAVKKLVDIGAKLYSEFAQDELAAVRLNAALSNSAQIGAGAESRFNEFASALQAVSVYGDDVTKTQIAQLAALGKGENEIRKLITAAADLASATGVDLDTAVKQLNATLQGNAGILGRQNAAVRALSEEELKAGKAIDIVADQYAGFAKKVGESASGSVVRLTNAWGDLREEGGKFIAGFATPIIQGLTNILSKANDTEEAIAELDKVIRTPSEVEKYDTLVRNIEKEKKLIAELQATKFSADKYDKAQIPFLEAANRKAIKDAQDRLKLFEITLPVQQSLAKAERDAAESLRKEEEAKARAERDAAAEAERLAKLAVLTANAIAQAEESARDEAQDLYDANKILEDMADSAGDIVDEIEKEPDAIEKIIAEWDKAAEAADKYGMVIDEVSDTFQAFSELQANRNDAYIAGLEDKLEAEKAAGKDTTDLEKFVNAEKNRIAKQQFNAEKANNIASAIMDGAAAAVEALKLGPAGIILAGIVAGLTAAQVGAIAGQQYVPFAQGGIVTGPTRALIGEAGPEAVIPLRDMDKGMPVAGGVTVNQYINGSIWQTKQLEALAVGAVATSKRGF